MFFVGEINQIYSMYSRIKKMTEGGGMLKSWTKSDRFEAIPGGI